MTNPKPTPRDIVFAQSSLTHLRTRLRDVGRLDAPARQALDWLEVVVGAQARALADDPLPVAQKPVQCEYRSHDESIFRRGECVRCGDNRLKDIGPEEKPEPYKPKVGERARLFKSQALRDDQHEGRVFEIREKTVPEGWWRVRCDGMGELYLHRDSVWEPVATQEPTANAIRDPKTCAHAFASTNYRVGDNREGPWFCVDCGAPMPAQEPTAEPAQPEASDPVPAVPRESYHIEHDDSVRRDGVYRIVPLSSYEDRQRQGSSARPRYVATVYDAELAERIKRLLNTDRGFEAEPPASEPSDPMSILRECIGIMGTEVSNPEWYESAREALATLERDRAAHAAEVERLCAERDGWREKLNAEIRLRGDERESNNANQVGLYDRAVTAEAEVERLRGELAIAWEDDPETAARGVRIAALEAELAAARAERPVPDDWGLAKALHLAASSIDDAPPVQFDLLDLAARQSWVRVARAAKAALLGVRREGPTDDRPWNYEAPPDSEIGQTHEILWDEDPGARLELVYSGRNIRGFAEWREAGLPEQKTAWYLGRSIKAWRRAEPKGQPEPATDDEGFDVIKVLRKLADDHEARVYALERAVERLGGGR